MNGLKFFKLMLKELKSIHQDNGLLGMLLCGIFHHGRFKLDLFFAFSKIFFFFTDKYIFFFFLWLFTLYFHILFFFTGVVAHFIELFLVHLVAVFLSGSTD